MRCRHRVGSGGRPESDALQREPFRGALRTVRMRRTLEVVYELWNSSPNEPQRRPPPNESQGLINLSFRGQCLYGKQPNATESRVLPDQPMVFFDLIDSDA
jgi:alkanesulfonate monooxygenase SsuD/methylene tetrahydromethanopterin reductase-like flavin-dependent oxidoreductase (luciferase family)